MAIALVLTACSDDDQGADDGAADGTASSGTTTSATAPTSAHADPEPVEYVVASPGGVQRVDAGGDPVSVTDAPAAAAFGMGESVVFQDSAPGVGIYPPRPQGLVQVWSGDQTSTLPADPEVTEVALLDARDIEGEPVALADIASGLFCREWLHPSALACAQGSGPPLGVSLDDGSVTALPGGPGAMLTVVRTG